MIMMRYYFLFRHRTSLLEDFSLWCITVSCLSLKSSCHLQSVALSGWINGIKWQWRTKSTLLNKGKVFNIRILDEALLLRVRKRINFESSPEPMATIMNKKAWILAQLHKIVKSSISHYITVMQQIAKASRQYIFSSVICQKESPILLQPTLYVD